MTDFISNNTFLITIAAVYVTFAFVYISMFIIHKRHTLSNNKKIFELLQKCILNGTINDSFGLELLCQSAKYEDFEMFVKCFLRFSLKTLPEDDYMKVDSLMRTIIIDKSKKKPFEECSPTDRQMLLSINEVVAKGDNEAAKYSMQELSSSLFEKDKIIRHQRRQQIGLTILTIVGLVINIIFGVLSLNLSDKDIQKIQQSVEVVIKSNSTNIQ